jgi:hypothetical protein
LLLWVCFFAGISNNVAQNVGAFQEMILKKASPLEITLPAKQLIANRLPTDKVRLKVSLKPDADMQQLTQEKQSALNAAAEAQVALKQNELIAASKAITGNYNLSEISLETLQQGEQLQPTMQNDLSITVQPIVSQKAATTPTQSLYPIMTIVYAELQDDKSQTQTPSHPITVVDNPDQDRIPVSIRRTTDSVINRYRSVNSN